MPKTLDLSVMENGKKMIQIQKSIWMFLKRKPIALQNIHVLSNPVKSLSLTSMLEKWKNWSWIRRWSNRPRYTLSVCLSVYIKFCGMAADLRKMTNRLDVSIRNWIHDIFFHFPTCNLEFIDIKSDYSESCECLWNFFKGGSLGLWISRLG